jgi:two-component system, chemotaxis family, chemotaxis protein CheY
MSTREAPLPTVLLVEDDADIRDVYRAAMSEAGLRVLSAGHGAEALTALAGEVAPPSLVVLDWMMPVMSGYQLLLHLEADERWAPVPVLVVTAVDRVINAPVAAVLNKPVRLRTLLEVVHKLCGLSHRGEAFHGAAAPRPRAETPRTVTAPTRVLRPQR